MKFLKFTYTSCIVALCACTLNIILILLPQNLFRKLTHEVVPDLLVNVVTMIIGFYICFSIKAPPIVRIIRIYTIIGAILAVPAFILKYSSYHTLFMVNDLVCGVVAFIFDLAWLRLAIRWFEDEKVMHNSLKEIQQIA